MTGFSHRVFGPLDLTPFRKFDILTPSTPHHTPHACDLFRVSFSFLLNGRPHLTSECDVIGTDTFHPDEAVQGLIGLDLLAACQFTLIGPSKTFALAF